jgi:hypothetical protein
LDGLHWTFWICFIFLAVERTDVQFGGEKKL